MKQGTLITRIVVMVLFFAVCAYLLFFVVTGLYDPYQTVMTYTYQLDDGAPLTGVVVRQEELLTGDTHRAELLPQEGEKVRAGAAVAAVYASEAAFLSQREARNLELQLEQINYSMGRSDAAGSAQQLDDALIEALARIHSGAGRNALDGLEEDGLELRSLVLKRTGDLTTDSQSLAALQQAAATVTTQLTAARQAAGSQTRYITVTRSGTFSGVADGFEDQITPADLESLTPGGLDKLLKREPVAPDGALGKLITDSTWYFAATVQEETAKRLEVGESYLIDFAGDVREEVRMTLTRLGESENGRRVAVFSANHSLERVTMARLESATLVFSRYTGVRVPTRALRVRDNEDGTTTLGVYTLVGRQAEFKPVEIVREGEGFYLLRGTAQNRRVLRAGDLIILSNQELYNGKVIM